MQKRTEKQVIIPLSYVNFEKKQKLDLEKGKSRDIFSFCVITVILLLLWFAAAVWFRKKQSMNSFFLFA